MKLSVIIPVYNTAEYLPECIASVPQTDGVELILVNDGSTDGKSPALCDALARSRRDICVIHSENRGLGGARMLGLSHARGEYVLFLDSDDLLVCGALEKIVSAAEKHSPDVIAFDFFLRSSDGRNVPHGRDVFVSDCAFTVREHPEYLCSLPNAWSRAWRRELFSRSEIAFPEHLRYEDLACIPALLAAARSIYAIPDALYIYRLRGGSIMTDASAERNRDMLSAFDLLLGHFDRLALADVFERELERLAVEHILLSASVRVLSARGGKARAAAGEFASYVRCRFPRYDAHIRLESLPRRQRLLFRLLSRGHYRAAQTLIFAYNTVK